MFIQLFAIRHIPTGKFMPLTARNRGYTQVEAGDFIELYAAVVPRLFKSRAGARWALNAWLKGAWIQEATMGEYGIEGYDPCPPKTPPADRRPEDMEVAVMRLETAEEGGTR